MRGLTLGTDILGSVQLVATCKKLISSDLQQYLTVLKNRPNFPQNSPIIMPVKVFSSLNDSPVLCVPLVPFPSHGAPEFKSPAPGSPCLCRYNLSLQTWCPNTPCVQTSVFPTIFILRNRWASFFFFLLENFSTKLNVKQISSVDNVSLLDKAGKVWATEKWPEKVPRMSSYRYLPISNI